jgi:hypothetical protein
LSTTVLFAVVVSAASKNSLPYSPEPPSDEMADEREQPSNKDGRNGSWLINGHCPHPIPSVEVIRDQQ